VSYKIRLFHLCLIATVLPAPAQLVVIRPASPVSIPVQVDGNSPFFWYEGEVHFLTSTGPHPVIGGGPSQLQFSWWDGVVIVPADRLPIWIEAAWVDSDGTVYGWYHHEPEGLCPGSGLTAPKIGAVVSQDGGRTFFDLGLILTSGDPVDCGAKNGFFGGGHGDFSVILDRDRSYFYFFFTNYGGDLAGQGVGVARMAFDHRSAPVGAVHKYFDGGWTQPGQGGRVQPVFPARVSWQRSDADSFWGPAVHWNTALESYVILMNRACCKPGWPQEGIYASFNADMSNPQGWTSPLRILRDIGFEPGFYPQVLGMGPGETDTLAGKTARLFIHGRSMWEISFEKTGSQEGPGNHPGDDGAGTPLPVRDGQSLTPVRAADRTDRCPKRYPGLGCRESSGAIPPAASR